MQPIVHGIGPTLLPHPERLYFWFGEPIETTRFKARRDRDRAARSIRDEVKLAVQEGIAFLLAERESDPRRGLRRRLLTRDTVDDGARALDERSSPRSK